MVDNEISRKNLPPMTQLVEICGGEGTGVDEARDLRRAYARLVRRLSIRITRLLLPTGLSANQVTVIGVIMGVIGAALLAVDRYWAQIAGLTLLQLSFVLDFSDGEIARFERIVENKVSGAGGAYLDWVGHYYIPAVMTAALGWSVFDGAGGEWALVAALVAILSLVRVPYSARDHIMWGVYRDRPELRGAEPMVRAALSRQGGDPALLDLDAEPAKRLAGGSGSGLLWSRYENLGQMIVFPGFVNFVTAAVIADMLLSTDYPSVDSVWARGTLLVLLGTVHLLHQLRAIAQGFAVTRTLK